MSPSCSVALAIERGEVNEIDCFVSLKRKLTSVSSLRNSISLHTAVIVVREL